MKEKKNTHKHTNSKQLFEVKDAARKHRTEQNLKLNQACYLFNTHFEDNLICF